MLLPDLSSRIENRDEFIGLWIDNRQVWSLEPITVRTGKCEIVHMVAAVMLLGSHMFDVEGEEGCRGLRKLTVLTPAACSASDVLAGGGIHQEEACFRRNSRAFACTIVTK